MNSFKRHPAWILAALFVCTSAIAEETPPESPFSGDVTLISDYVYRGMTQTWGKPALQGSLNYNHASGFFAGVWMSTVSDKNFADGFVEIDLSAGYEGVINDDWSYGVGALHVMYPGANYQKTLPVGTYPSQKYDMSEVNASVTYKWLTLEYNRTITDVLGFNQKTGYTGRTKGSSYYNLSAALPLPHEYELGLHVGYQDLKPSLAIPSVSGSTDPDYVDVSISLSKPIWENVTGTLTLWHNFNDDLFVNIPSATDPADTLTLDDSWITFALSAEF